MTNWLLAKEENTTCNTYYYVSRLSFFIKSINAGCSCCFFIHSFSPCVLATLCRITALPCPCPGCSILEKLEKHLCVCLQCKGRCFLSTRVFTLVPGVVRMCAATYRKCCTQHLFFYVVTVAGNQSDGGTRHPGEFEGEACSD